MNEEKNTATPLRPKPEDIDYWGGCPTCWRNDGYLNIGREHWFICHKHRVKWLVGENLFSAWRFEPENQWLANRDRIAGYRKVDPKDPPRAGDEGMSTMSEVKSNERYVTVKHDIPHQLDEADFYLAEALKALTFPELYGLEDPESQGRALRKLRNEIEVVQAHMNRARELSYCLASGIVTPDAPKPRFGGRELACGPSSSA